MALSKKNRLTAKKDIDRIFKNGKTVKGSFLFVKFLNNQREHSRFVFVIPAKHVPLAVNRNKIKRILSEEIKKFLFFSKNKHDLVVLLSKKTEKSDHNHLAEDLRKILSKL